MGATTSRAGMMKRRQSGRRRGAGVMSGMRRPLAGDFVKCKRLDITTKGAESTSHCRLVLVQPFCLTRFLYANRRPLRSKTLCLMSATTLQDTEFPTGDLWVFGYGSLIWRPGFEFLERVPARLIGEHRALCVYSFVHRGTPEKPGLVLGLDRGGACRGIAYRVDGTARAGTVAYLRAREQVTMVYREVWRDVLLGGEPERRARALVYVVDRGHSQYAGRLDIEQQLHFVRQGHGHSGANRDYVLATVGELEAQGFRDAKQLLRCRRPNGNHPEPLKP